MVVASKKPAARSAAFKFLSDEKALGSSAPFSAVPDITRTIVSSKASMIVPEVIVCVVELAYHLLLLRFIVGYRDVSFAWVVGLFQGAPVLKDFIIFVLAQFNYISSSNKHGLLILNAVTTLFSKGLVSFLMFLYAIDLDLALRMSTSKTAFLDLYTTGYMEGIDAIIYYSDHFTHDYASVFKPALIIFGFCFLFDLFSHSSSVGWLSGSQQWYSKLPKNFRIGQPMIVLGLLALVWSVLDKLAMLIYFSIIFCTSDRLLVLIHQFLWNFPWLLLASTGVRLILSSYGEWVFSTQKNVEKPIIEHPSNRIGHMWDLAIHGTAFIVYITLIYLREQTDYKQETLIGFVACAMIERVLFSIINIVCVIQRYRYPPILNPMLL